MSISDSVDWPVGVHCLVGLVVKASASRAEDPEFDSLSRRRDLFRVESCHGLKNWHSLGHNASSQTCCNWQPALKTKTMMILEMITLMLTTMTAAATSNRIIIIIISSSSNNNNKSLFVYEMLICTDETVTVLGLSSTT